MPELFPRISSENGLCPGIMCKQRVLLHSVGLQPCMLTGPLASQVLFEKLNRRISLFQGTLCQVKVTGSRLRHLDRPKSQRTRRASYTVIWQTIIARYSAKRNRSVQELCQLRNQTKHRTTIQIHISETPKQ